MATTKNILLVLASALLLAPACSDSSGPKATVFGTYAMITVNGTPLPATVADEEAGIVRVNSGSLTINSASAFSAVTNWAVISQGQTDTRNDACTGFFTQNGNSLSFDEATSSNPSCGGNYTGTWDGDNTLTVAYNASVQAVFRK